ncbi:MAG TPA: cysteine--tRNA ligase [Candidatus Babeliales bacterium]|nr:cysteine--tRNA ligase [Candidatus Babeliales bacterium]
MIKITNTLTGNKEEFKPYNQNSVLMYVCGITPYDDAHIGHGRVYISFDVISRLFRLFGYDVQYCRNFTDIDDKLLNKAEAEFGDRLRYQEISERYIARYHQDVAALGCLPPTYEPRVTRCIPEIIRFIQGLIDAGKAYESEGDVYFSIATFPAYGALSKRHVEDLQVGARVQVSDKKRDPLDFALWKSEPEGTFWKSPWGYGRPGWHIECSAMAKQFLGEHIDIHGGGLDLIFPHHENEIAQSEALYGAPFARYWVHNGMVRIDQEKMSKSLGNFFTLRDLFKQFDPMVLRYYIIAHHYRAPLDFAFDDIKAIEKSYKRLVRIFNDVIADPELDLTAVAKSDVAQRMIDFLADDINTPGAFGVLFDALGDIQKNESELRLIKGILQHIFGLSLQPIAEQEVVMTTEIEQKLAEREEARLAKDWARADAIRQQLVDMGVPVNDKRS